MNLDPHTLSLRERISRLTEMQEHRSISSLNCPTRNIVSLCYLGNKQRPWGYKMPGCPSWSWNLETPSSCFEIWLYRVLTALCNSYLCAFISCQFVTLIRTWTVFLLQHNLWTISAKWDFFCDDPYFSFIHSLTQNPNLVSLDSSSSNLERIWVNLRNS